jgi:hypothetical protein
LANTAPTRQQGASARHFSDSTDDWTAGLRPSARAKALQMDDEGKGKEDMGTESKSRVGIFIGYSLLSLWLS